MCSNRIIPPARCGGRGLGSSGSCSQSKRVNLKWLKHEGIKTKFSRLFLANSSQIQAENENVLSWEKDCWIKIDCGLFWFLEQIRRRLSLKALIEFSQINAALPWLIKLTSVAVCPLVNSSPLTKHTFSCGGALSNTPIINKKLANEWHTYLQSLALEWKPPFLFLFSLCLQALRASTWRLFFWLRPDWARAYTISAAVDTIMQKLPSIYSSHFIAIVTKFKNNPCIS